jgi:hypothetical protein
MFDTTKPNTEMILNHAKTTWEIKYVCVFSNEIVVL